MGFFDFGSAKEQSDAWESGEPPKHEASLLNESLGAAAGFAAMRAYENKQRSEGKPVSHGVAKEILAGLAAGEAERLIQTKGADFVDTEKAKWEAKRHAEKLYDSQYADKDEWHPDHDSQFNY
ncbi:hypothetical protein M406DRAFT_354766 [Cryphonectria parasitica EP155]|uniref:CipC-like antibiotic response protein n=1 Tax=Cryphonectria parasitica (strain ATCC 38755 / EP155) TaxID=660469 RepID=A0A9P4YD41_CRYP1|nr:uncharacterized protein M406DRAFT_354766 [Cryphonectria parasitica EP155]KAF3771292.1 hypothetical protein M406DRAFT_354766 [Cryphonectria parasitica EP155]